MTDFKELFWSTEELETPVEATVKGVIPGWLEGSFVRVGPGKFDLGNFTVNNWFDGYAVLHKFDIENGKVTFSKKFLQSDAYKRALLAGRPVITEFATRAYPDPGKNFFSRMVSAVIPDEFTDNDAVGLVEINGAVYATTETCIIRRFDPDTLETMEKIDFEKLIGVQFVSPHPQTDANGDVYNLALSLKPSPKYHLVKIPKLPSGGPEDALPKASIFATIPARWKTCFSYYHSFGMSENYFVIIEQPYLVNSLRLIATRIEGKALKDCCEWTPSEKNQFTVIEKSTGNVVKVKYMAAEPFFFLHIMNVYEDNNQLVVDLDAYPSPALFDKMYMSKLRNNEFSSCDPSQPTRFILPLLKDIKDVPTQQNLVTGKSIATAEKMQNETIILTGEILSKAGMEMPTINKSFYRKQYRYFYTTGAYEPNFKNSICKVDITNREVKTWKDNEYTYPGEPYFVCNPTANEEDAGVLLVSVTDVRKDSNDFLLVADAKDMKEIARAEVTTDVPQAVHGIFLSK